MMPNNVHDYTYTAAAAAHDYTYTAAAAAAAAAAAVMVAIGPWQVVRLQEAESSGQLVPTAGLLPTPSPRSIGK